VTIRYSCPRCKAVLEAPDDRVGEKLNCPKCQQRLQNPAPPPNKTVLGTWQAGPPPVRRTTVAPPEAAPENYPSPVQGSPPPRPPETVDAPPPPSTKEAGTPPPREKGPREKYCHECGAVIRSKAEICPECGVRQPGRTRAVVEKFDGEPHRGTAILVLGVLSLFTMPVPLGLIAWLWANEDLKKMDAGVMDPEGRGSTQAGKVCGMISVILSIGALVLVLLYFLCLFAACGVFTVPWGPSRDEPHHPPNINPPGRRAGLMVLPVTIPGPPVSSYGSAVLHEKDATGRNRPGDERHGPGSSGHRARPWASLDHVTGILVGSARDHPGTGADLG
jgi:hypothetical protein